MRIFDSKKMLCKLLRSGFAVFGLVSIFFIIIPTFPALAADPKPAVVPTGPATVTPKLNVDIGVNLATGQVAETGKVLYESYLGTYIAGVYKYLLGIVVIAAALMMIYGGFKYILSSSMEGIKDGKENMVNAVIGLVLVFGSYTLLAMLNPAVLTFKPLELPIVEPVVYSVPEAVFQRLQDAALAEGCTASPAIKSAVAAAAGGTKPATRMNPNNPFDPRLTLPIDELNKMIEKVAKDADVDPCVLRAIISTESGGKQNSIGHDEDANGVQYQSRLDFLRSGVTFLKKTFTVVALPKKCTAAACTKIVKDNEATKNDDDITATPPDYGLDWRFSHGLGYGQFTMYPRTNDMSCTGKDGSNGRKIGGACFTVPCVMTWEGQTDATVKLLSAIIKTVDKTDACKIFEMYSGEHGDKTCTGRLASKMKKYTSCKGSKK